MKQHFAKDLREKSALVRLALVAWVDSRIFLQFSRLTLHASYVFTKMAVVVLLKFLTVPRIFTVDSSNMHLLTKKVGCVLGAF